MSILELWYCTLFIEKKINSDSLYIHLRMEILESGCKLMELKRNSHPAKPHHPLLARPLFG
jgi:hypothetical protein